MTRTVLIADDHAPTRADVRRALEACGFEVVGDESNARAAIETALDRKPDLCLLDVHMPGGGIEATKVISAALPDTVVVMLTVSRNDEDLFDALRAGASGYLLKDLDAARLCDAVERVLEGEAPLSASLVGRLIDEFRQRGRRGPLRIPGRKGVELTSKEWEVLDLLRGGYSTQEIADKLYVSPVTVRTHVSAILRKLRVPNREAALKLMEPE